jgi:hypothetical protein
MLARMETEAAGLAPEAVPGSRRPTHAGRLAALDRRRVAGAVLVAGWVVWFAVLWVGQARVVSVATLEDDLRAGRVLAFREVLLEPADQGSEWVDTPGLGYGPVDGEGRLTDDSAVEETGAGVTLTYRVDGPVATQRVLDLGGDRATVTAVEDRLRAEGVPPDLSLGHELTRRTGGPGQLSGLLGLVTFGLIVLGPRPGRGSRWFWFWLLPAPFALGVLAYAVVELVRPGRLHGSDAGRRRLPGALGLLIAVVGGGMVTLGSAALADLAPVLVLRP